MDRLPQGSLDNPIFMQFGRLKGIPLFIDVDTYTDMYTDVLSDVESSYRYLMDEGQGSINVNSWSGDSRYFAFVSYDIVY